MSSTYAILGQNLGCFSERSTNPIHALGSPAIGNLGDLWLYVQATETVEIGTCSVAADFKVTDQAGDYTADAAFGAGEYGWVRKTVSPF